MQIYQARNATILLKHESHAILVDPMLGPKGSMAPYTLFRYSPRKNPIIDLPEDAAEILDQATCALITHLHPDHLDEPAISQLKERKTPVTCSHLDSKKLRKKGLAIETEVEYWNKSSFLGGQITGIPARHGYGWVAGPMGNVMGYFIELPGAPTVYIAADTILTSDVQRVLDELRPEVSIIPAGIARLDIGKPLMMNQQEILRFAHNAPGKVIANHQEALNHCPHTREELRAAALRTGGVDNLIIAQDGSWLEL